MGFTSNHYDKGKMQWCYGLLSKIFQCAN